MTYSKLADNAGNRRDLALGELVIAHAHYFESLENDDEEAIDRAAEDLIDLQFGFVEAFNDYIAMTIAERHHSLSKEWRSA